MSRPTFLSTAAKMDSYNYATLQSNNPTSVRDSQSTFPLDPNHHRYTTYKVYNNDYQPTCYPKHSRPDQRVGIHGAGSQHSKSFASMTYINPSREPLQVNANSIPSFSYSSQESFSQNFPNLQRNAREIDPVQHLYRNNSTPAYEQDPTFYSTGQNGANVELQRYHPYDKQYIPSGYLYGGEEAQGTSPVKPKRKRANANQLKVLNQLFQQTFFPSTELRIELGKQLGMSPRTVQIWFQNKRQAWRIRNKFFAGKDDAKFGDIPSSPETSATTTPVIASPKSSTCSSPKHSMMAKNSDCQLPPIFKLNSATVVEHHENRFTHYTESQSTTKLERPLLPSLNEIIKQEPRTIGMGSFYY
ncbi:hypothetical protein K7432_007967 [Basidiobolus ranarum]|uniref:Homeobox domain-containing protein n=1 Tax=Basidiobolus ranarum TaxID=34480 RepID=A0ABR2W092_9FUNG